MEQVFKYILGLGAAVMMPIIFTIIGMCIRMKFSKALKSWPIRRSRFCGFRSSHSSVDN